eukprot:c42996_g1_i1 orf=183-1049(+)
MGCFYTRCILFVVAFLLHQPYLALAWGVDGHFAVCTIAESLFSQKTSNAVQSLLPTDAQGNLSAYCSWADEVRFLPEYSWSAPLHYINTPDNLCTYNYNRDCHNSEGVPNMCAAGAINNYTSQLTAYGSTDPQYNLTEALLFLAHIVGDIHQPLHVGFTTDEGGNKIPVYWYDQEENLHHVWDDMIIDTALERYYDSDIEGFVNDLSQNITNNGADVSEWSRCGGGEVACPNIYATESIKAACDWAYATATPGSHLEDPYFLSRLPIVEKRLEQGGVRLGAILNRIFT